MAFIRWSCACTVIRLIASLPQPSSSRSARSGSGAPSSPTLWTRPCVWLRRRSRRRALPQRHQRIAARAAGEHQQFHDGAFKLGADFSHQFTHVISPGLRGDAAVGCFSIRSFYNESSHLNRVTTMRVQTGRQIAKTDPEWCGAKMRDAVGKKPSAPILSAAKFRAA